MYSRRALDAAKAASGDKKLTSDMVTTELATDAGGCKTCAESSELSAAAWRRVACAEPSAGTKSLFKSIAGICARRF